MTDAYAAPAPDDFADPQGFAQRRAQALAFQGQQSNPDDAARALKLAQVTGAPASVVNSNLEDFEEQTRNAVSSGLIRGNSKLSEYINSHPLAAQLSNDDWGNLDKVSEGLKKHGENTLLGDIGDVYKGLWHSITTVPGQSETTIEALKGAEELMQRQGLSPDAISTRLANIREAGQRGEVLQNLLFSIPMAIAAPAIGAYRQYVSRPIQEATGFPMEVTEGLTLAGAAALGSGAAGLKMAREAKIAVERVEPYLQEGKEPPVGLHEVIDKEKAEQAKVDVKNLDELLRDAQASATRERDPQMFANFVSQHTNAKINISAEAVRKLYGDKPPQAEDGILGFVPRLEDQLRLAEIGGGDVEVPLSEWLANVDPKVAKELRDDIRVRSGGVTLNELKDKGEAKAEPPEGVPELVGSGDPAVDAVRQGAGLDAYHGTPHEFMQFDLSRIGTGEGAQSYGHGIYLAENPEVAGEYRDKLSAGATQRALQQLYPTKGDAQNQAPGGVYKVKVKVGKEEFFDWDKALDQQTPAIQEKLKQILGAEEWEKRKYADGKTAIRQGMFAFSDEQVAKKLSEAGIPGIKYLDQGSRGTPYDIKAGEREIKRVEEEIAKVRKDIANNKDNPGLLPGYFKNRESDIKELENRQKVVQDRIDEEKAGVGKTHNLVVFDPTNLEITHKDGVSVKPEPAVKRRFVGERPTTQAKQLELPETTRMEDREVFAKAAAIGMTKDQYQRYTKLIEKRSAEDAEAQLKAKVADETRRQSPEWKENAEALSKEVRADFVDRPYIAADEFFRTGQLYGQSLGKRPKLDPSSLSAEQRRGIPRQYFEDGGLHPDDAANLFGYSSGKEMASELSNLMQSREQSGLQPKAFVERLVKEETERRMEAKYGKFKENVIEAAKEHVLSDTQLDLLHEETVALATKAKQQLPIDQKPLKAQVVAEVGKTPIGSIDSDKFLADAGRAGRGAELALLKEDFAEAFRLKQAQYFSVVKAQEAKKLEKQLDVFNRQAKSLSARDLSGRMPQEYGNWIHDILSRVGKPVKRSLQDLQESISHGEYKTLDDFVQGKEADLREVPMADFLLDPHFRAEFESLSADEFRAVHDSIKGMVKNGRDERKILKAGEEADLAEVKGKMLEQLQTFAELHYDAEGKRWLGPIPPKVASAIRTYGVAHLQMESFLNRVERGDPRGTFSQYVMRDLIKAANGEAAMRREYAKRIMELKDAVDLDEKIPDSPFKDPFSGDQIAMTRKNLRAVLQNVGNSSNLDKLARGYKTPPEQILSWLYQHATKEDWDWAQKQGDIFKDLKAESDKMYRNLSGVEPTSIPIEPIQTPHGVYEGWYHPIVYHSLWEGSSKKLMGKDALEQQNYVRATTPQGYTKQRTGYAGPLALDLDATPNRIGQIIHDVTMRPSVINASKIFYDKEIRAEVSKRFGKEYRDLMVPYIQDVANSANFKSEAQKVGSQALEWFRQNAIAALIGFNPGTVLKHGSTALVNSITEVGAANFSKAVHGLFSVNERTGETNWAFVRRESEEIQRRMQHYQETVGGAHQHTLGEESMREAIIRLGSKPVAWSDMMSAVPTWLAKYEKSMSEGLSHGEAVGDADLAVRRAHGSTAITSRPAIARGGALSAWMSSLYGFFNHIMNRQYEMAWRANDALKGIETQGIGPGAAAIPALTTMFMSYVLWPAITEELVSPLPEGKKENWAVKAAKALTFSVTGSWIGVRDFAHAALAGRDPSAGLMSTTFKSVSDVFRDLGRGKEAFGKQHAGNLIQHATTMFGMLTGLTNATEGRVGKFLHDVSVGKERPKTVGEWWYGLRHGKSEKAK